MQGEAEELTGRGRSVNRVGFLESERRDLDIEVLAALGDHRVRAPHEPTRGFQRATRRVGEGFAWRELRLFTDHVIAADLVRATIPVGDEPMTTNQLHGLIAFIGDADGVLKVPMALEGLRMFGGVPGFDFDPHVVGNGFRCRAGS